ncbi:MAG: hypothetical protein EBZ81_12625 [Betaproteobacteria bacterium]|nr:hypothetical protein [Betaproteobacteria bacterium]
MKTMYLVAAFAPLLGAILAGFFGRSIGRIPSALITITLVAVSAVASVMTLMDVMAGNSFNGALYQWAQVGEIKFEVGFLIDSITAMMMVVVSSVSLCVHVYTMGYMEDDDGYQRFFAYISLFTFSMMMLVMSNNFLQLFFGWEAVGLVSYLLIGFWYTRPTAIFANMKAFLVNRVGDFGFALGIGMIVYHTGSLDYVEVFAALPDLVGKTVQILPGEAWAVLTLTAILLFVGAMGKSAQFPLHVWLPDSMEGPTPISALIHAATMVTAGEGHVPHESPAVVTVPLMLLAIPSVIIGAYTIEPMVIGDFFKDAIMVLPQHPAIASFRAEFHGVFGMVAHAPFTLPFWLMIAGLVLAWWGSLAQPSLGPSLRRALKPIVSLMENKYFLDAFNEKVLAAGARLIGKGLWKAGDQGIIDGVAVNGSARTIGWLASLVRHLQTGFIYDYAIAMIVGVAILLYWFVPIANR